MSTSNATHYCWPGCGCAEEAARRDGLAPRTGVVEHLVCPCNTVWMSILPPPPCPFHSIVYGPSTWVQPDKVHTSNEIKLDLSEETWYRALAPLKAPEIMQELLKGLLWPLLGDSDE